jgi:hypothetical protein
MSTPHANESNVPLALSYARSPSPSRQSNASDDSQELRALELEEGPAIPYHAPGRFYRPRSESMTLFRFENELLPLSTTLSDPDMYREVGEKSISLLSGTRNESVYGIVLNIKLLGIALIAGLQVSFVLFKNLHLDVLEIPDWLRNLVNYIS